MLRSLFTTLSLLLVPIISHCQIDSSIFAQDSSEEITITVLREQCARGTWNFRYLGTDSHYRLSPFLIPLDTTNVLAGYSSRVFVQAFEARRHKLNSDDLMLSWEQADKLDSIFENLSSSENLVSLYDKRYNKVLRAYKKRGNLSGSFDGYFYFNAFQITARVRYDGKRNIFIPCFFSTCRESLMRNIESDCYLLLELKSITPYTFKRTYRKFKVSDSK